MLNKKLVGTDALLVQRLNTNKPKDLYHITVDQLSSYVGLHSDAYMADLTDQVDENTERIELLESSVTLLVNELQVVKLDVTRHDAEIDSLQKSVSKLQLNIDEINTKAKVNLNYRWIQNDSDKVDTNNIQSGEMYAEWDAYGTAINKLYYSTTDDDGYPVTEAYIFEGETLELSSAYNPSPSNPSKLRYRSVHLVDDTPHKGSNYISIKVTTVHEFHDGDYPYYEEGVNDFVTRSDFYPNALNIDDFEQHVEDTYLPLNGSESMTGNFKIDNANARIDLESSDDKGSYINYNNILTFLQNNVPRLEIGSTINLKVDLDAGNQEIKNLKQSSNNSSAATVGYVKQKISDIESTIDDKFEPGDRVAKNSNQGVEVGGFALIGSTLYVRTN